MALIWGPFSQDHAGKPDLSWCHSLQILMQYQFTPETNIKAQRRGDKMCQGCNVFPCCCGCSLLGDTTCRGRTRCGPMPWVASRKWSHDIFETIWNLLLAYIILCIKMPGSTTHVSLLLSILIPTYIFISYRHPSSGFNPRCQKLSSTLLHSPFHIPKA